MEELAKWELNGREIKNAIKTVIGNGWWGTTMNQQRELLCDRNAYKDGTHCAWVCWSLLLVCRQQRSNKGG
jgi:hypothetical protein